jgi:hypothetical protein
MTLLVVIGPVAAGKYSIARLIAARTGIRNVPLDLIRWDYFCRVDWLAGEIDVGGPDLARYLSDIGHLVEYRLYFHTVVLGSGHHSGSWPAIRPART